MSEKTGATPGINIGPSNEYAKNIAELESFRLQLEDSRLSPAASELALVPYGAAREGENITPLTIASFRPLPHEVGMNLFTNTLAPRLGRSTELFERIETIKQTPIPNDSQSLAARKKITQGMSTHAELSKTAELIDAFRNQFHKG